VRRPPLPLILVAIAMLALGVTASPFLSGLRPAVERYARARVAAHASALGLTGSAEYDDEVRDRAVFAAEAGLSFLHTHAESMGLVAFFASTLVASVVRDRRARGLLHALLVAGALFPLGYLVYALGVLERGRDSGIETAEAWVLTPLGTAAILGLVGLAVALARRPAATE
jgi:hypothetical protein